MQVIVTAEVIVLVLVIVVSLVQNGNCAGGAVQVVVVNSSICSGNSVSSKDVSNSSTSISGSDVGISGSSSSSSSKTSNSSCGYTSSRSIIKEY